MKESPMAHEPIEIPITLSDAQWARLAPLLTHLDTVATPPDLLRAVLSTLLYRAVTGSGWDQLPERYPPPIVVQQTYERWQQLGLLDLISAGLLVQLSDAPDNYSRGG